MLVAENRHAASARLEYLDHFLEEPVTRVKRLPHLVLRIPAVFTNDDHAVDGQFARAKRERLRDRCMDGHAMTLCRPTGQVALRKLVDVEGGEIHFRPAPAA